MSKGSVFNKIRFALDAAITYGTLREAKKIARSGQTAAKKSGSAAEFAYFQGQRDLLDRRFTSAIEHFDEAIRQNPADGAAYNDRALCMVEIGIIDEALEYFDRGIAVEPDYATVYHNKGWLLNNIGRHKEAISCFRRALRLEPGRAVTYDNLADAYFNLQHFRAARDAYRKVLELLKPGTCRQIAKQIRQKIREIEENFLIKP